MYVLGGIAGDQLVTVSGSGFDNTTSVWICDMRCVRDPAANQSASEFSCRTPMAAGKVTWTANQNCFVCRATKKRYCIMRSYLKSRNDPKGLSS